MGLKSEKSSNFVKFDSCLKGLVRYEVQQTITKLIMRIITTDSTGKTSDKKTHHRNTKLQQEKHRFHQITECPELEGTPRDH